MRSSSMRVFALTVFALAGGLTLAEEVAAVSPEGDAALVGYWSGNIEIPGRPIAVSVVVTRDGKAWSAKVDVPDQGIRKIDMTGVAATGKDVTFQIPGVPGNPTFSGALVDGGSAIAGDYTQGGQSLPFRLARADKPADYDVDLYADYKKPGRKGKGVSGEWLGMLEAGPHRYRMKLNMTVAEGAQSGTLVSVDQRATSFPAEELTIDGQTVTFAVTRVGARFEGTLSDDGSEISGEWTQGGQGLPLTFRRAG